MIQLESTMANLDHQRKTYENKASFQKANFNTEIVFVENFDQNQILNDNIYLL